MVYINFKFYINNIYTYTLKSLLIALIENNYFLGYNVTILAYGQTGSGKTHSMGTNFVDDSNEEEKGIIPRAIQNIFNEVKNKAGEAKFSIKASFIEVIFFLCYLLLLIIYIIINSQVYFSNYLMFI